MGFFADLYRVTAGDSCLRTFVTKAAAISYGKDVVRESHPNVGRIQIEGRDERTGDWIVLRDFGAPVKAEQRNARFWIWRGPETLDYVKLTLKPGQKLEYAEGGPTDEGYSHEYYSWELEDGIVKREYHRESRDCDGRGAYHHSDECPLSLLKDSEPCWCSDRPMTLAKHGKPIMLPSWDKANASQYDEYAELAGY